MPNLKKSSVWHHYTEHAEGRKIVGKCKYCGQTYANNATRMKRHLAALCQRCPEKVQRSFQKMLQKNHEPVLRKYPRPHEVGDSVKTENVTKEESINATVPHQGDDAACGSLLQNFSSRMDCSIPRALVARFVDPALEADRGKKSDTLAISTSDTRIPIDDNEDRKEHYKLMAQAHVFPSSTQPCHSPVLGPHSEVSTTIRMINEAEHLTLMSDGWSNQLESNLLNIRFATPEPIYLKTIISKSCHHTGEYIAGLLSDEMETVAPLRVQAIVTTQSNNMNTAWLILKAKYPHLIVFGCLAVGLNNLANGLVHLNTIKTLFADCSAIVNAFNRFHMIDCKFMVQKEEDGAESGIIHEATRCLESLLVAKSCLQYAALDMNLSKVIPLNICKQTLDEDVFWVQVQGVYNLLLPLSEAILKVEATTPNISKIPQIFRKLNETLIESLPILLLSRTEEDILKERFKQTCEFCCHPVHLAADLLDPRHFRDNLSEEEFSIAFDAVMDIAKNVPETDEISVATDLAEYRARDKLWSRDIIWRTAKFMSPLTWWKGYFKSRQLSKIAVRILSIPSTAKSNEHNE